MKRKHTTYGTLAYYRHGLQQSGIIEKCADVLLDESHMTIVLIVVRYRCYADMVYITRTSRKCFRVENGGEMHCFRSYKEALLYTDEVVTRLLRAKERRDNYGEIFMQKLREEALNRGKKP